VARAIALLDKPNSASFGMAPVVVADDASVRVLGFASASAHRGRGVTRPQVEELIRGGHALPVDADVPSALKPNTVALWFGDVFAKSAKALDLPAAPLPASPLEARGGTFFLGPSAALYPYLERWIIRAFQKFRSEQSDESRKEIAKLMRWVLPHRPESLAAAWATASKPERELELQSRTFELDKTAAQIRSSHEHFLKSAGDELADLRLVVFTGGTGVGRGELAERFAKQFSLECRSFRRSVVEQSSHAASLEDAKEKQVLADNGQREVDLSPLAFALSVLDSPPEKGRILVLDSLRHKKMRETLGWLQPKQVFVVAVTTDESERRRRVQARKIDPDTLFKHATEREIPDLTKQADLRIRDVATDQELRQIFDLVSHG